MSTAMPMRPPLLSLRIAPQSSRIEQFNLRLAEAARKMTVRELAAIIHRSPSTVRRRRRGRGWTVAEIAMLLHATDLEIADLFDGENTA